MRFFDPAVYTHYFFAPPGADGPARAALEEVLTAAYADCQPGGAAPERLDLSGRPGHPVAPPVPRHQREGFELEADVRTVDGVVVFRAGVVRRGEFDAADLPDLPPVRPTALAAAHPLGALTAYSVEVDPALSESGLEASAWVFAACVLPDGDRHLLRTGPGVVIVGPTGTQPTLVLVHRQGQTPPLAAHLFHVALPDLMLHCLQAWATAAHLRSVLARSARDDAALQDLLRAPPGVSASRLRRRSGRLAAGHAALVQGIAETEAAVKQLHRTQRAFEQTAQGARLGEAGAQLRHILLEPLTADAQHQARVALERHTATHRRAQIAWHSLRADIDLLAADTARNLVLLLGLLVVLQSLTAFHPLVTGPQAGPAASSAYLGLFGAILVLFVLIRLWTGRRDAVK